MIVQEWKNTFHRNHFGLLSDLLMIWRTTMKASNKKRDENIIIKWGDLPCSSLKVIAANAIWSCEMECSLWFVQSRKLHDLNNLVQWVHHNGAHCFWNICWGNLSKRHGYHPLCHVYCTFSLLMILCSCCCYFISINLLSAINNVDVAAATAIAAADDDDVIMIYLAGSAIKIADKTSSTSHHRIAAKGNSFARFVVKISGINLCIV